MQHDVFSKGETQFGSCGVGKRSYSCEFRLFPDQQCLFQKHSPSGEVLVLSDWNPGSPFSMADPGFLRGERSQPRRGSQPIIWPIFPENCMKMKKFWL